MNAILRNINVGMLVLVCTLFAGCEDDEMPTPMEPTTGIHGIHGVVGRAGLGVYEARLNVLEILRRLHVGAHQVHSPPVGGVAPDQHGLGGEHPVGETDDENSARPQDTVHLFEHFDGLGQILGGNGDEHCVEGLVVKRKDGIVVHVVNNYDITKAVLVELNR